jgi:hypothetical protein
LDSQESVVPNYYLHGKQDECFEIIENENANDITINDIIPPTRIAGLFDVCDKDNAENISRWLRYGYNNCSMYWIRIMLKTSVVGSDVLGKNNNACLLQQI